MRRLKHAVIAVAACASVAALVAQSVKVDFERDELGKPPKMSSFAVAGQGRSGVWVVMKDDQAYGNALVQRDAAPTDYRFPVALHNDVTAKDVDLAVQFKVVSGRGDQSAWLAGATAT